MQRGSCRARATSSGLSVGGDREEILLNVEDRKALVHSASGDLALRSGEAMEVKVWRVRGWLDVMSSGKSVRFSGRDRFDGYGAR